MTNLRTFELFAFTLLMSAATAAAGTINFDNLASGAVVSGPGIFPDLTFSSTIGSTLTNRDAWPGPTFSSPNCAWGPGMDMYRADFSIPGIRSVSVTLGDFGGSDADPIYLEAHSAGGGLLASASGLSPAGFSGGIDLSVQTGADIAYVLFWGGGPFPNSVGFDNFVYSVAADVPSISFRSAGGHLLLSWPGAFLGWYAQSNAVSVSASTAWHDIPTSQAGTNLDIPINPARSQVFYRLRR